MSYYSILYILPLEHSLLGSGRSFARITRIVIIIIIIILIIIIKKRRLIIIVIIMISIIIITIIIIIIITILIIIRIIVAIPVLLVRPRTLLRAQDEDAGELEARSLRSLSLGRRGFPFRTKSFEK